MLSLILNIQENSFLQNKNYHDLSAAQRAFVKYTHHPGIFWHNWIPTRIQNLVIFTKIGKHYVTLET